MFKKRKIQKEQKEVKKELTEAEKKEALIDPSIPMNKQRHLR